MKTCSSPGCLVEGKIMTELLERAFTGANKLSPNEQNEFAKRWLTELQSEQRWQKSFAASQDELDKLANEALKEHAAGLSQPRCQV